MLHGYRAFVTALDTADFSWTERAKSVGGAQSSGFLARLSFPLYGYLASDFGPILSPGQSPQERVYEVLLRCNVFYPKRIQNYNDTKGRHL
jgi:hypothetical protein